MLPSLVSKNAKVMVGIFFKRKFFFSISFDLISSKNTLALAKLIVCRISLIDNVSLSPY